MDLVARIREDFGIQLIGVQPTGLGADARAALFSGVTADGRTYAVKTSTAPQPGLAVADFLAGRGVPGVPAPLHTRDGGLMAAGDGGAVSLVPWIDGPRAIDTGLDRAQWRAFGELLGAVHANGGDAAKTGLPLPIDRQDPTREVERARAFAGRLRAARAGRPGDAVVGELASLWARSGSAVLAVADRAEETASSPVWVDAPVVVCHADPHHGNLLLDDQDGVSLVDWDDAVFAPREADLIFVIGGVYSHAPITRAEVGWFFDGYTPASGGVTPAHLDVDLLGYYRSVRALTDFLDFADDALDPSRHGPERADALRIAAGALSPEGIVALALALST